jgi:hypothetical protein
MYSRLAGLKGGGARADCFELFRIVLPIISTNNPPFWPFSGGSIPAHAAAGLAALPVAPNMHENIKKTENLQLNALYLLSPRQMCTFIWRGAGGPAPSHGREAVVPHCFETPIPRNPKKRGFRPCGRLAHKWAHLYLGKRSQKKMRKSFLRVTSCPWWCRFLFLPGIQNRSYQMISSVYCQLS